MVVECKLPDIGEGIAEGEIIQWLVGVGDPVRTDQPVVEVLTDKASVEIPAPITGRVHELRAAEGDAVPIGAVIFTLTEEGEEAPAVVAPAAAAEGTSSAEAGEQADVRAAPSARQAARQLGVDLHAVTGSGRGGAIRRVDVETHEGGGGEPAPSEPATQSPARNFEPIALQRQEGEERIPLRGVRKKIAEMMTRSMFTATHYTVVEEVDLTDLETLRKSAAAIAEPRGVKINCLPFIMKAAALALQEYPQFNAQLDEATQEIVRYSHVNLGIAVDHEDGLIVPVVPDVDWKGVLQLATELQQLEDKVRTGHITPGDLRDSTFSIISVEHIGGIMATPIINFPEVAVLGVHRIQRKPAVVDERIEIRSLMYLCMSIDHRLVDGADACRFLVHVKRLLEEPGLLAL